MPESSIIGDVEFVRVYPGSFLMGSATYPERAPRLKMTLTKPFLIAKTPVTQRQWQALMGTKPWRTSSEYMDGYENLDYPALGIGYSQATEYTKKFCDKFGVNAKLPTDCQWEYSARTGRDIEYPWGDDLEEAKDYAHVDYAGDYELAVPRAVGTLLPNAWGLYDMAGNVREIVRDLCVPDPESPYLKPRHFTGTVDFELKGGTHYITRNSGFDEGKVNLYCGRRKLLAMDERDISVGFRISVDL
jgi:formylglycine-generating enzyme required for sulfatase activity